ncbi:MAG: acyltransferase [Betaproteobacteria bacterium]|nr:acyltransferase [Betaproteobacteria bacterium]
MFFCISGFVIAKDLLPRIEGKNGTEYWREIGAFWVRRLYRLSPSAWIWLAVPLLQTPFFQHLPLFSFNRANIADAVSAVLHVSNFRFLKCTNDFSGCGWFAHYWSLSLEEQFYLMLPVIFFFFRRFLVPVILVLVLSQLFLVRTQWNGSPAGIYSNRCTSAWGATRYVFRIGNLEVLEPRIDKLP